jgi:hypothetical protein
MKKIAVIDIDGILWNMAPAWYTELIKINPECPYPGKTTAWNFAKGYMSNEDFKKTIDTIHMKQDQFPCFKGVHKLTNMLYEADFYIKIASHRTDKSKDITAKWLYNNDIYYHELHTVPDKHFLLEDAAIFIDDNPDSQEYALSNNVIVFSIEYPYNRHVKDVYFFDNFTNMVSGVESFLDYTKSYKEAKRIFHFN